MHGPETQLLVVDADEPSALVVVGADLRAEAFDRPIAWVLCGKLNAKLAAAMPGGCAAAMVCTDVWYLNNNHLRLLPTISVGGPEVNALSAFLIGRVPMVFAAEDRFVVHADVGMEQLLACVWGVDPEQTAAGTSVFEERYLASFVESMARAMSEA